MYAAIAPWSEKDNSYYLELLYGLGQAYGFELQTQWQKLTEEQRQIILHGEETAKTPRTPRKKKSFFAIFVSLRFVFPHKPNGYSSLESEIIAT